MGFERPLPPLGTPVRVTTVLLNTLSKKWPANASMTIVHNVYIERLPHLQGFRNFDHNQGLQFVYSER